MRKLISAIFCALVLLGAMPADAQVKSYHYKSIDLQYKVNTDTTVDVTEKVTFDFAGEFHEAWRDFSYNKVDSYTDVSVTDSETGQVYKYVSSKQDKYDQNSWGKFTTFDQDGAFHIAWYYSQADTSHTWTLKYKIRGSLAFGSEEDRFYFNAISKFTEPVDEAHITVITPENDKNKIKSFIYTDPQPGYVQKAEGIDQPEFYIGAIPTGGIATVDVSWPKGLVDKSAYWHWYIVNNWGWIGGLLVFLLLVFAALVHYIRYERLPQMHRTIVAQYEPPANLPPAVMEYIATEQVSSKSVAATLVDLAEKGKITIEDLGQKTDYGKIVGLIISGIFLSIFAYLFLEAFGPSVIIGFLLLVLIGMFTGRKIFIMEHTYRIKNTQKQMQLSDFEEKLVNWLFVSKDEVTTTDLKKRTTGYEFFQQYSKYVKKYFKDSQDYFEISPREGLHGKLSVANLRTVLVSSLFIGGFFFDAITGAGLGQLTLFLIGCLVGGIILLWQWKLNVRLSNTGIELKDKVLGFKEFLKVTGKDRMAVYSPDLFEKYLAYAIIFGVEKQWSAKFEGMNVQPTWFVGYHGSSFSGSSGGFSSTAFSASFASSFSSAVGTSAGGGGAGGGGAGGGGGGGGGGAG